MRRIIWPRPSHGQHGATTQPNTPSVTPSAIIYFQDAFESGDFSAWSTTSGGSPQTPVVNTVRPHTGTYSYEQQYMVDNSGGGGHADENRYCQENFADFGQASGLSSFYFRFYVYIKTPEVDATPSKIVQRKLSRLQSSLTGPDATNWEVLFNGFSGSGGSPTTDTRLGLGYFAPTFTQVSNIGTLAYDTWYCLEQQVILNTPGSSDGTFKLWIDGVLSYSNTALPLRNTQTTNVKYLKLGAQLDVPAATIGDEYHYYDQVVISDSQIGV